MNVPAENDDAYENEEACGKNRREDEPPLFSHDEPEKECGREILHGNPETEADARKNWPVLPGQIVTKNQRYRKRDIDLSESEAINAATLLCSA